MVIRMVSGALGKGTGRVGNRRTNRIQTTALFRSARILKRVLETLGDLLSLSHQRKTIWCEKVARGIIMIMTVLLIVVYALGTVPKRLKKKTGGISQYWKNGDHPDYNIDEIGQNTEKSPGDLRRLSVFQFPLEDLQLILV